MNYLAKLYLHGVCFSRGGLPIGEDSPIISTQYIFDLEEEEKNITEGKSKRGKTMKMKTVQIRNFIQTGV